jgi:hypothetical protein
VHRYGLVLEGEQRVTARVLEDPWPAGSSCGQHLPGQAELDKFFAPGDRALWCSHLRGGEVVGAVAQDHYGCGWSPCSWACSPCSWWPSAAGPGFKALVSFAFAALLIWKQMTPLFLRGHDPILVTLAC